MSDEGEQQRLAKNHLLRLAQLLCFSKKDESISIFSINQSTGALTWVSNTSNTSAWCNGPIRTDPTGNYIYVQGNGGIVIYKINHTTGALTTAPSSPAPIPEATGAYMTWFAVAPAQ